MKGYAEREVFTDTEIELLGKATRLVAQAPYDYDGVEVRCHELARAVGKLLGLQHCDGHFGLVEHTWLWVGEFDPENPWRSAIPTVLDVYVCGALPQVQLVSMKSTAMPIAYRRGDPRHDVREDVIERLVREMTRSDICPDCEGSGNSPRECECCHGGGRRNPECDKCGARTCRIEVQFPTRPGVWIPHCDECHEEMKAAAEEVNQHEMKRFGGAYGLAEWLVRSIRPELAP